MYINADALINKIPELKAYVDHHNPWIIAITEIIPKNCRIPVPKTELKISITVQVQKNLKAQEVLLKTKFEESGVK